MSPETKCTKCGDPLSLCHCNTLVIESSPRNSLPVANVEDALESKIFVEIYSEETPINFSAYFDAEETSVRLPEAATETAREFDATARSPAVGWPLANPQVLGGLDFDSSDFWYLTHSGAQIAETTLDTSSLLVLPAPDLTFESALDFAVPQTIEVLRSLPSAYSFGEVFGSARTCGRCFVGEIKSDNHDLCEACFLAEYYYSSKLIRSECCGQLIQSTCAQDSCFYHGILYRYLDDTVYPSSPANVPTPPASPTSALTRMTVTQPRQRFWGRELLINAGEALLEVGGSALIGSVLGVHPVAAGVCGSLISKYIKR